MMNIKGRGYGEGEAEFFRISIIIQRPRQAVAETPFRLA